MRLLYVAMLALAVGLAGCSADADGPNDADVAFTTRMIEHHARGIQVANHTIGREHTDPRVAGLAEEIRVDRTKEIDTLAGWLRDWEKPVPETGFATGDGHTHDEDEVLPELADAPDARFDRLWLEMMIEHHEEGVAMAEAVQDDGQSAAVTELAERIATAQQAEIEKMRAWLA